MSKDAHRPVPPAQRSFARGMRRRMTDPEYRLWRALKAHRLEGLGFRRQVPIGRYVADFFCPAARLVVEVDGGRHFTDAIEAADAVRTEWLNEAGYQVRASPPSKSCRITTLNASV